jgi:hypothetical protein
VNARTKSSAGQAERISRLAQVDPVELECLLWHSLPGVLDVSVSCSSRGRFGRTRNACSASIGSMHLEETQQPTATKFPKEELYGSRRILGRYLGYAEPRWLA